MLRLPQLTTSFLVLASVTLIASPTLLSQSRAAQAYTYFRAGNTAAFPAAPTRPGYALMGGGSDLDQAFRFLCDRAGDGDFLVLRATGDDEYNSYIPHHRHANPVH